MRGRRESPYGRVGKNVGRFVFRLRFANTEVQPSSSPWARELRRPDSACFVIPRKDVFMRSIGCNCISLSSHSSWSSFSASCPKSQQQTPSGASPSPFHPPSSMPNTFFRFLLPFIVATQQSLAKGQEVAGKHRRSRNKVGDEWDGGEPQISTREHSLGTRSFQNSPVV